MKESRISPEDWFAARRSWESDATVSYAQVADSLGVSKALVAKKARSEKWQRGLAASFSSKLDAVHETPKFTENARPSPMQAPMVHGVRAEKESPASQLNNGAADIPVMPPGLTLDQQQDWIEGAVLARQRALNDSQAREIRAAKSTVYTAIKTAGKDGGFDAARTARQVVSALAETHKSEMTNEIERVKLALNAFQGGRPRGCQIVVHQRAGVSIMGPNDSEAVIEARAAGADAQMTVLHARRIVADADAAIVRKAGWDVVDAGGNNV